MTTPNSAEYISKSVEDGCSQKNVRPKARYQT